MTNTFLKGVWKLRSRWSGIISQDCFFMCHTTISQTCHSGTTKDMQKTESPSIKRQWNANTGGYGFPIQNKLASEPTCSISLYVVQLSLCEASYAKP